MDSPNKPRQGATGGKSPAAPNQPSIRGYQITGRLGEGGMGIVWGGIQLSTKRRVALKVLSAAGFGSERARTRFAREVELAASLQHPNIARVYDSGLDQGVYFYAMELIDGYALDRFVEKQKLGPKDLLRLMRQICMAVQHAHQRGVIHRDLKPSNIVISEDGQPHILDFGLAKDVLHDTQQQVTMEGDLSGTPAYMSPEQAAGQADRVDTRADVFSLGVILYRMLTGKTPHELTGTHLAVLRRIAEEDVIRPREVMPHIDADLEAILLKALAHQPEDRYASAGDLAADIQNYLDGEPITAIPATTAYFLRKRLKKHWGKFAVSALIAVVLMGMAVVAYLRVRWERDRADQAAQLSMNDDQKLQAETQELKDERDKAVQAQADAEASRARADNEASAATRAAEGEKEARAGMERALQDAIKERDRADQEAQAAGAARKNEQQAKAEALASQKHIEEVAHQVKVDSAQALFAKGLAQKSAGQTEDALTSLGQARMQFNDLGLPTGGVDMAMFDIYSQSRRPIMTFTAATGRICCVAFSHDGRFVASAGDTNLGLWNVLTGQRIKDFPGHSGVAQAVDISPDGQTLLSGGLDGTMRTWDVAGGKMLRKFVADPSEVLSVKFSPDGKMAISGGHDGKVKLWNLSGGDVPLRTYSGHTQLVNCVAFSPDGRTILSAGNDTSAKMWSVDNTTELHTFSGHKKGVMRVAFSPDGRLAFSTGADDSIKIWDPASGTVVREMVADQGGVYALAVSSNGQKLLTGGDDHIIKLWDVQSGQLLRKYTGHTGYIDSVAASPDGRAAASGSWDGKICLWSLGDMMDRQRFGGHFGSEAAMSISPDSRIALTADPDFSLHLWDLASGKELAKLAGHTAAVREIAFGASGKTAVSAGADKTVRLWDIPTGKELRTLIGHTGDILSVAISPDNSMVVSGGADNMGRLWDANTGQALADLSGHSAAVTCVAFSPDGHLVLTGSEDKTVKIWDVAARKEIITFSEHQDKIAGVGFGADGQTACSCDLTGQVWFWNPRNGNLVRQSHIPGVDPSRRVRKITFAPDGRVTVWRASGTMAVWDPGNEKYLQEFPESTGIISPDGDGLLARSENGEIDYWNFGQIGPYLQFAQSLPKAQIALKDDPTDAQSLAVLGNWYAFCGMDAWAVEDLMQARAAGANVSFLTLARDYWQMGDLHKAAQAFGAALDNREADADYLTLCLKALAQTSGQGNQ